MTAELPVIEGPILGRFGQTQMQSIVERTVLAPLRSECSLALYGIGGQKGAVIEKAEWQLRDMTRTEDTPQGLDFSSDETAPGRKVLYSLREEIQEHYGLYFIGVFGMGIKFTIHPLLGMQWREQEFDERSNGHAKQLCRMWRNAISALGNRAPENTKEIVPLVDGRAATLDQVHSVVQARLFVGFPGDFGKRGDVEKWRASEDFIQQRKRQRRQRRRKKERDNP